jgi:hypothetical protein
VIAGGFIEKPVELFASLAGVARLDADSQSKL